MQFIDLKKQYEIHKDAIDQAIHEVLDDGRYIRGPVVDKLEAELAEYVGVKHCIGVSSGTDSLLIALMALGVGPGDEVITTPFTWISPSEVIQMLGAKPVFVDIDPATFNIDVDQIEAAITPRTKAIMPVSLFGQMPDFKKINAIADKHGLAVIEDGAQSFGAEQNGVMSCSAALVGSTSFFPAKPLGCYGDGGALFTNDDSMADKMRAIMNHGVDGTRLHQYVGINGRLDAMQAAVIRAKLPHFPQEVKDRARIGARYTELLKDCCTTPAIQEGNTHVYAQYTLRVADREAVIEEMTKAGIPHAVHYRKAVFEQPVFAQLNVDANMFPETMKACQEVVSLPMHPWLTEEEQDRVVAAVQAAQLVNV